jgi:STE24 endopeptidase
MKAVFAVSAAVLVFLIVTSQLQPSVEIVNQAKEQGFSIREIADGRLFAWERRWIFWGRVAADFLFLSALALLPIGKRITRIVGERVGYRWLPQIAILGGIAWLGRWLIDLPFSFAFWLLLRSWEMSNLSFFGWFGQLLLASLVEFVAMAIPFLGLYSLMRHVPKIWPLAAGAGALVLGAFFAFMLPEVIAPMFNKFTPLAKSKYADKFPDMRAHVKVMGGPLAIVDPDINVVDASRQSRHSNAYFTGIGNRQQIVLYDNLLDRHTPEEVETIIAHEMGHWFYNHILYGIFYGSIALTIGLFALDFILARHIERGEWRTPGDPEGVFLVLWLAWLATSAALPIESAVSRNFERQADQVSLDMSKNPAAFISAEIKMAKDNRSDVAPLPWNVLLFATHPPVVDRINMAKEWKPLQ